MRLRIKWQCVNWCMVVWCTRNVRRETAVQHGFSHFFVLNHIRKERSESARQRRIPLYKSDVQQQQARTLMTGLNQKHNKWSEAFFMKTLKQNVQITVSCSFLKKRWKKERSERDMGRKLERNPLTQKFAHTREQGWRRRKELHYRQNSFDLFCWRLRLRLHRGHHTCLSSFSLVRITTHCH